ncbi:carboxypeptidase-like regulatory domain-containing protein [Zhouia sp. PK063]|uniref:carboxypeptidase-like regulatory domain-containing protein n=1 Tax=Zhouia sp. PK063 TaxID=3373602 RepID=UPI0037AC7E4C
MRTVFLCSVLCFFFNVSLSQIVISGKVTDAENTILPGASVVVTSVNADAIITYAIANSKGVFEVNVKSVQPKLVLTISYLGFEKKSVVIENKTQHINVILKASQEQLKEVIVKSKPIEQKGDTLNYNVSSFKNQKDRVIADVIKKLPGIEIMPDGTIYYQGAPISKYYIENLDLLEGKYNLANENLPVNAVAKVQILENHQPIKVLDSLEFSSRAAINIKLKKNISLSGTAQVGLGGIPLVYTTKITPMFFSRKKQAIASYQTNNAGENSTQEVKNLYSNASRENFTIKHDNWLSVSNLKEPRLSSNLWLQNKTHLGTLNFLIPLNENKTTQLKVNTTYFNDEQHQRGEANTTYFTPTDTVTLKEVTQNRFLKNVLSSQIIIEKNEKNRYLKNRLNFSGEWYHDLGAVIRNTSLVKQQLQNPQQGVQNQLKILTPIGKQLINFESNIGYTRTNQELKIKPGVFTAALNHGNTYNELHQLVSSEKIFANHSAGITKAFGKFTISSKLGLALLKQRLNTHILVDTTAYNYENYLNNTVFNNADVYLNTQLQYHNSNKSLKLVLQLPITYKNIEISDKDDARNLHKIRIEPNLFLEKKLSANWFATANTVLQYRYGNMQQLYPGFIVSRYNYMARFNSPIPENRIENYNANLQYKNPLHQVFVTGSFRYNEQHNNLLYATAIDDNGAQTIEALKKGNTSNIKTVQLNTNKYLTSLKTSLKINIAKNWALQQQMLNDEIVNLKTEYVNWGMYISAQPLTWLNIEYSSKFANFTTKLLNTVQKSNTEEYQLEAAVFPTNTQQFNVEANYITTSFPTVNRNCFLNASYQYTFIKPKLDVLLSWNNILNTKQFVNTNQGDYYVASSTYQLRPSQVLATIKFSF